jgi:dsDNA-specific endonuclease/ATPase MutS2
VEERELVERIEAILRETARERERAREPVGHHVQCAAEGESAGVKQRFSGRVPACCTTARRSGETAFIEPRECVEPANRLAGLELDARREEQRILLELTRELFDQEPRIVEAAARVAELELAVIRPRSAASTTRACPRSRARATGRARRSCARGARHPLLSSRRGAARCPRWCRSTYASAASSICW